MISLSHSINDAFISENHFVTPINSRARRVMIHFSQRLSVKDPITEKEKDLKRINLTPATQNTWRAICRRMASFASHLFYVLRFLFQHCY